MISDSPYEIHIAKDHWSRYNRYESFTDFVQALLTQLIEYDDGEPITFTLSMGLQEVEYYDK